jgi:hypothetical protein
VAKIETRKNHEDSLLMPQQSTPMRVYPKDYNLSKFKNLNQVGQKDFGIQSLAHKLLR